MVSCGSSIHNVEVGNVNVTYGCDSSYECLSSGTYGSYSLFDGLVACIRYALNLFQNSGSGSSSFALVSISVGSGNCSFQFGNEGSERSFVNYSFQLPYIVWLELIISVGQLSLGVGNRSVGVSTPVCTVGVGRTNGILAIHEEEYLTFPVVAVVTTDIDVTILDNIT